MKYSTLQKVTLTTLALVASLAISAQAGQPKPVASEASQLPKATSGLAGKYRFHIPPVPQVPQVVLYDQYDNASGNATSSQDFEVAFDPFDDFIADDFVVPGGQTWTVESIDADGIPFNCSGSCIPDSFNVFFYTDSGGLPGTQVYSATSQSFALVGSTYSITLTVPAVLTAAPYWVSVQARMDFTGNGQWGWTDRTVQSTVGAAWQNPGGGFGVCTTWDRKTTCIPTAGGPDQVFRLNGTMGTGGGITLSAHVRRQQGKRLVVLEWSPADGGDMNVTLNGRLLGTTADDGQAQDKIGASTGVFDYQVCETDSGDCSNTARVVVH